MVFNFLSVNVEGQLLLITNENKAKIRIHCMKLIFINSPLCFIYNK